MAWMKGVREAAKKRAGNVTAGIASRALDAMQKVENVRNAPKKVTAAAKARLGSVAGKAIDVAERVPGASRMATRAMDVAQRVPVAGRVAKNARRLVEARLKNVSQQAESEDERPMKKAQPARTAKPAAAKAPPKPRREEREEPLPEPTDPDLRLDEGTARVTTTSRGRKTVPLAVAAARKARAKQAPQTGFKPKKGQKKNLRH